MQINTCAVYNTYHICVCDACAHNTFTPSARNNLHMFFFNHSTVWQVRPAASSLTLESMPHQRLVNLGPAQNYHKFVQNMTNPVGHQIEQKNKNKKTFHQKNGVDHEIGKSNRQRLYHWILFWHFGFRSNAGRYKRTIGSCWPWAGIQSLAS